MKINNRKNMPSHYKIAKYWNENYSLIGDSKLGYYELNEKECFACGDHLQIERAHIIPLYISNNNDVANIHLLCGRCHIESGNYALMGYWNWLKWKRVNEFELSITHTHKRLRMCGLNLQEIIDNNVNIIFPINEEKFNNIMNKINLYSYIEIKFNKFMEKFNNE